MKILDLCTRPSSEHHPQQFVLIYSRLKQGINKAGVLGWTCPLRAVCQSGRGNIWAPERCLIVLAVCWRDSLVDIVNPELQAKKVVQRTKVAVQHSKEKSRERLQKTCILGSVLFGKVFILGFVTGHQLSPILFLYFLAFANIFVLVQKILISMYSH